MTLNILFSDLYGQLSGGAAQVVVPPHDVYPIEKGPDGTKRIYFSANDLEFMAETKGRDMRVNFANGEWFATLRDGQVVACESKYRDLL